MKEPDKNKRYFLENLNEEQLFQLFNKLNDIDESFKTITFEDFKSCREKTLYYNLITKEFSLFFFPSPWNAGEICATELFEDEKKIKFSDFPTKESCNKDLHKLINELEIALKFTKKKKSKIKVYEQLVEQLNKM